MTFATDVTALWAGRNGGKTTLSRSLVARAKLPQVVYIDPVAAEGHPSAAAVIAAIDAGAPVAVLRSANRTECLRCLYAVALASTKARPLYLVCDEAPLYLDKATPALLKTLYQGRHRGLGMMILAQRPTAVAAAIRSQAAVTYWGRLSDHNDLQVASQAIGPARARFLANAKPGQFTRHPDNAEDMSWQNAPPKSAPPRSAKPRPAPQMAASKRGAASDRKPLSTGSRRAG